MMKREELTKAIMDKLPENPTKEQLEEIVKAVTSEAAPAENKPVSESAASGEDKPTIQDAVNPVEASQEAQTTTVEEPTQTELPEQISEQSQGGQVQEIKFDDSLFKPFTLGSTLEQSPTGNVMSNTKPTNDYEQAYQNSTKNEKVSFEKSKDGSKDLAKNKDKKLDKCGDMKVLKKK